MRGGRDECSAHATPLLEAVMLDHAAVERRVDGWQVAGKIVHDGRKASPNRWHLRCWS